jgi:broad specificity phosphatase PhoE
MKKVYLVRHGESNANARTAKVYEGHNAPLTERGYEQAYIVAERAAKLPVDTLIASTMVRAQQTAEIIAARIGKTMTSSDLFTERRSPQSHIGRVWDDPETQRLEDEWIATFFVDGVRVLDGENFADMKKRAEDALAYLETHSASNILVVTHGFFLRMLVGTVLFGDLFTPQLFKLSDTTMKTRNTGITILCNDLPDKGAHWYMLAWNDYAHLG